MLNPLEALIGMHMRMWVQWLDATQKMFRAWGLWGRPADATTFTPAVSGTVVPFRRGCVGEADLKR